jgi:hypothetical protein
MVFRTNITSFQNIVPTVFLFEKRFNSFHAVLQVEQSSYLLFYGFTDHVLTAEDDYFSWLLRLNIINCLRRECAVRQDNRSLVFSPA